MIGTNQTGAAARGLDLHTTLAVNPDGVPLGVLRAGFDAPLAPDPDRKGSKPREERKSFRWVEGLRDCGQAAQRLPETRVVCTMDREADFLDLFIERREHAPQVDLLVRAKVDRVLGKDTTPDGHQVSRRLFDQVRSSPARATCTIEVNRLSARVKASKQARKNPRASRVADTTLRYQSVELPCPGAAPVKLWVVHAREEHPPPDAEPLEWFVLTTLRVTSTADAQRVLQWYALRWRIEDYFRILKSGCKVEELQHHTAERLERAIAIKMVVGWRIQLMVRLGRELPELPSELLFSDGELRVLATFGRSRKLSPPARLGEAVELVARLGGWLGRPREPPGAQLMWHRLYSARGHDLRLRATRRIRMTSSRASQVPRSVVGQGQFLARWREVDQAAGAGRARPPPNSTTSVHADWDRQLRRPIPVVIRCGRLVVDTPRTVFPPSLGAGRQPRPASSSAK